jgi:hypothetical protein
MSQETLERIVEDVKRLTPQEQQQLRALLDQGLNDQSEDMETKERLLMQRLLQEGIIESIPTMEHDPYERFSPITVQGEPVSETIIRERR